MRILVMIAGTLLLASSGMLHAASKRTTIVISDTHFGVGRAGSGWHPWEDFRWHDEFDGFLKHIGKGGQTDLILNGDTFELWQYLSPKCTADKPEVGCNAQEALQQIRHVLGEHDAAVKSLRRFASRGTNRIYIVPGNHDAALLFSEVRDEVERKLGKNVVVEPDGVWRSEDRVLLSAHGHELTEANRFPDWPRPFTPEGRLHRPWGEQAVQQFYNEIESRYPIIDNIVSEADGLLYGFAAEGVKGSIRSGRRFALFLLQESSPYLFGRIIGPSGRTPKGDQQWDIAAIRHHGAKFLVDVTRTDHPAYPSLVAAEKAGLLTGAFAGLTDDDIRAICDEREAWHSVEPKVQPCPVPMIGGGMKSIFEWSDARLRTYLQTLSAARTPDFDVAIFGHTHRVEEPRSLTFDGRAPVTFVVTGAWQRGIEAVELEHKRLESGIGRSEVLKQMKIEELPACYSFVIIEPYAAKPVVRMRYWVRDHHKTWTAMDRCP